MINPVQIRNFKQQVITLRDLAVDAIAGELKEPDLTESELHQYLEILRRFQATIDQLEQIARMGE